MTLIKFPPYAPDLADVGEAFTSRMSNVLPRADGYGPFQTLATFSQALPAACRGYFFARNSDSTVTLFAATATRLYILNNTTLAWSDVSKGATDYTTIAGDAQWSFCQFNSIVVASQKNAKMQSYDLTSSTAFDDLGGSPPQAGYVAVLGTFILATDLLSNPYAIQWCDTDGITTWDGSGLSDTQVFADGGRVRCAEEIQSNVAIVCQDGIIRRMTFNPGSAEIFDFEKLHQDRGILAPYSLAIASGIAYFVSTRGVVKIDSNGNIVTIGEERVDRTFLGLHDSNVSDAILELAYDANSPQLVLGANDPSRSLYIIVYKSKAGQVGLFDRGFAYHTSLDRWAPFAQMGEFLEPVAKPGLTLESLDAIAPGAVAITGAANNGSGLIRLTVPDTSTIVEGAFRSISGVAGTVEANGAFALHVVNSTHVDLTGSAFVHAYSTSTGVIAGSVDALTFSLDDVTSSTLPSLSAIDSSHRIGIFSGDNLEAQLFTPEQSGGGRRMDINGGAPYTDAQNAYLCAVMRESFNAAETIGAEQIQDIDGNCWLLENTRYGRLRLRVPLGEHWTWAKGVDPIAALGSAY